MLAEHPILTTQKWIESWRFSNIAQEQLEEFLVSVSDESNRRVNKFSYLVCDGELVDPATKKIIKLQTRTDLEKKEAKVFNDLKIWANNSKDGSAIWFSPKLEGVYPNNKAIFYKISNNLDFPPQKVLFSAAVVLDDSNLFSENLRDKLIIKDENFTLASFLELLAAQSQDLPSHSRSEISYFARRIKQGDDPGLIITEMKARGVVGSNPLNCRDFDQFFSGSGFTNYSLVLDFRTKEKWDWHIGDCIVPECGRKNVEVGPCSVCRKCQGKFDAEELAV
jgi:hypothetical protein